MASIGIVGAGIMGRMLGTDLAWRGWDVALFDRDDAHATGSCTWASAGMVAPSCELESAEREISALGFAGLQRWRELSERLSGSIDFRQEGSIVVAHPNDARELDRLRQKILAASPRPEFMKELATREIHELEPELSAQFTAGLFMNYEGQVDNRSVVRVLGETLEEEGATFHVGAEVSGIQSHEVHVGEDVHRFDWVADCRGLGARDELTDLRGIRGELVYVSAPEVHLTRPVRLMHPRYPIYVVPRANQQYVIGATALESEDLSPISVRSTLELLSAAYTLHTGFAEARLLETVVSCRPAFSDNRPRIVCEDGLIRINGLYRHGFLISPILSRLACDHLEGRDASAEAAGILQESVA